MFKTSDWGGTRVTCPECWASGIVYGSHVRRDKDGLWDRCNECRARIPLKEEEIPPFYQRTAPFYESA